MYDRSVSVVIPAYNAAAYLALAIESALAQTRPPSEVIVVDDGSTDDTAAIAKSYAPRVTYLAQQNQGVSVARNRGIASSDGDYVAFLDADDLWDPEKLDAQLTLLSESPGARASCTYFREVDESLQPITDPESVRAVDTSLRALLTAGNVIGTPSTVMCERRLLQSLGGFDAELSLCADWDMWIRVATQTRFALLERPLVSYRRHADNMSRDLELLEQDSVRALEKALSSPVLPASLRGLRRSVLSRNWLVLAGSYMKYGSRAAAMRCALRAILLQPSRILELLSSARRARSRRAS